MNYTLIFFLLSAAILIISTITICLAPIINGFLNDGNGNRWGDMNCKLLFDKYEYNKNLKPQPNNEQLNALKKTSNICKRKKAMNGLEYGSLICDIVLGGICTILGLLHYLEIGKKIENKTGLFGMISGIIGFILTFIYIIFSGFIFDNDNNGTQKLFPSRGYLKWNGYKYVPPFDLDKLEENPDIEYATFSELGKTQYNYDSQFFKNILNFNYGSCKEITIDPSNGLETGNYKREFSTETLANYRNANCDYIWNDLDLKFDSLSSKNKYIYDRWITTIILSVFIAVFNIGLILFGFFLFKNFGESSAGSKPIPMSTTIALKNK